MKGICLIVVFALVELSKGEKGIGRQSLVVIIGSGAIIAVRIVDKDFDLSQLWCGDRGPVD
jgi:hypothetical protein